MLGRTKIRMGILAKVSACTRRLETGVRRMTANSVVTSSSRHGLAAVGSEAYEKSLARANSTVINITARRVFGVTSSGRLPALHAAAGMKSTRDLFLQHWGELLDSALRATAGSIQDRMKAWIRRDYKMPSTDTAVNRCTLPPPSASHDLRVPVP